MHHQDFYEDVAWWFGGDDESDAVRRFGREIVNATRQWQSRHIRPGQDDPEYLAKVAKRVAVATSNSSAGAKVETDGNREQREEPSEDQAYKDQAVEEEEEEQVEEQQEEQQADEYQVQGEQAGKEQLEEEANERCRKALDDPCP